MCKWWASHTMRLISSFGDLEQAWPTFPVKGHIGDNFNIEYMISFTITQLYSDRKKGSHRQNVNQGVWLCSNNILLSKRTLGSSLFAEPWSGTCQTSPLKMATSSFLCFCPLTKWHGVNVCLRLGVVSNYDRLCVITQWTFSFHRLKGCRSGSKVPACGSGQGSSSRLMTVAFSLSAPTVGRKVESCRVFRKGTNLSWDSSTPVPLASSLGPTFF